MIYTPAHIEGISKKLIAQWEGPYEIMSKIDAVTYRVKKINKSKMKIIPVHVQRMRLFRPWN